jgi:hypothetical protein
MNKILTTEELNELQKVLDDTTTVENAITLSKISIVLSFAIVFSIGFITGALYGLL